MSLNETISHLFEQNVVDLHIGKQEKEFQVEARQLVMTAAGGGRGRVSITHQTRGSSVVEAIEVVSKQVTECFDMRARVAPVNHEPVVA